MERTRGIALCWCAAIAAGVMTVASCDSESDEPTVRRVTGSGPVGDPPASRKEAQAAAREELLREFNADDLTIDRELLLKAAAGKDAIRSLTGPERIAVSDQTEWGPSTRIIEVVIDGEAVAYPVVMFNVHEIANDTVGDQPVFVSYCPLCDSALVANRTIETESGETITLEFGVSGFLVHSNMVMYDRTDHALWSQVFMQALSGPYAGRQLDVLPVQLTSLEDFVDRHPDGEVLTAYVDGTRRPYEMAGQRYQAMLSGPGLPFDVPHAGRQLPPKTLGLGIRADDNAWFIPHADVPTGGLTIETERGGVRIRTTPQGFWVDELPAGVATLQTFYHSWSAYHPHTTVYGHDQSARGPSPVRGSAFDMVKVMTLADLNTQDLRIDDEDLLGVVPLDSIPALRGSVRVPLADASPLPDDARMIVVENSGHVVGYPLLLLNYHEVINDIVGDMPLAITYCPLCDSAAVFDRRLAIDENDESDSASTLTFGVTGLLAHGNVVLYDKQYKSLWSQLSMEAISGPFAGTRLNTLPFEMRTFADFRKRYPGAELATFETPYARDYARDPYTSYHRSDALQYPPRRIGRELEPKTAGVGVVTPGGSAFIPLDALGDEPRVVEAAGLSVTLSRSAAGVIVHNAPADVHVVQTYYYAWSAFHPQTSILK